MSTHKPVIAYCRLDEAIHRFCVYIMMDEAEIYYDRTHFLISRRQFSHPIHTFLSW